MSRFPCKIGLFVLSFTVIAHLLRTAVQLVSQRQPRLMRLLVNPSMMWPHMAAAVGMVGRGRSAVAMA